MALSSESRLTIKLAAEDATGSAFDTAESKMGKLKSAAGKLAGAFAGAGAATIVGALSEAARAAAEEEASIARLAQAIDNSGGSWEKQGAAIEALIETRQGLAFSDDELRSSMSMLVAQTGSVDEAMSQQAAAMDLARGANIDLETASKLVGKVTDENVNVLKRYGITMQDGATETDVLAAIQKKFGGQAETFGNTTQGAIQKVSNSIDNWKESLGGALGPAQGVLGVLPGISSGATILGGVAGQLAPKIIGLGASFIGMLPAIIAVAAPFLPIIAAVAAIAAGVFLLKLAWENNFLGIRDIAETVVTFIGEKFEGFKTFMGTLAEKAGEFGAMLKGVFDGLPGPVKAAIDIITGPIRGLISLVQGAIGWLQSLGIARAQNPLPPRDEEQRRGERGQGVTELATGGIVTRPTLAMIGERGAEAVIPLSRGNGFGGVSIGNITINGNVDSRERISELADAISDDIMRRLYAQRNMAY